MPILLRILLCVLLVAGCTPVSAVKDRSGIQTVAVISAVDDTLSMIYVGFMKNGREEIPVDWGLRQRLADRLKSALARDYAVTALESDVSALVSQAALPTRGSNFFTPDDAVIAAVKANVKPGQVDAIIVAADRSGAMYSYRVGGPDAPYYVGMMYKVYVLDGRTFALLGNEYGSIPRARPLPVLQYDNPAIDVDLGWRGEPYASLPAEKKEFIRRAVYELIDRSAPFTVKRLGLVG